MCYSKKKQPWSTHLSPLLRAMPMSFSMPPASRKAFAFSMFFVMTSCSAQQMAVTVSSDMALLGEPVVPEVALLVALLLLLLLLPGNRWIKSLMAYLPGVGGENQVKYWSSIILCTAPCILPILLETPWEVILKIASGLILWTIERTDIEASEQHEHSFLICTTYVCKTIQYVRVKVYIFND